MTITTVDLVGRRVLHVASYTTEGKEPAQRVVLWTAWIDDDTFPISSPAVTFDAEHLPDVVAALAALEGEA